MITIYNTDLVKNKRDYTCEISGYTVNAVLMEMDKDNATVYFACSRQNRDSELGKLLIHPLLDEKKEFILEENYNKVFSATLSNGDDIMYVIKDWKPLFEEQCLSYYKYD